MPARKPVSGTLELIVNLARALNERTAPVIGDQVVQHDLHPGQHSLDYADTTRAHFERDRFVAVRRPRRATHLALGAGRRELSCGGCTSGR